MIQRTFNSPRRKSADAFISFFHFCPLRHAVKHRVKRNVIQVPLSGMFLYIHIQQPVYSTYFLQPPHLPPG